MSIEDDGQTSFDMEAAVASVADGLGLGQKDEDELPEGKPETEAAAAPAGDTTTVPTKEGEPPAGAVAAPRPAPKSWAKEYHEDWSKLTPKQQVYIEKREKDMLDGTEQWRSEASVAKQYKEILAPYKPMFAAAGIDEAKGMQWLLNAQWRLTNGSIEERKRAFDEMGESLGLIAQAARDPNAPAPDPLILQLRTRLEGVESALTQSQQRQLDDAKAVAQGQVDKFASDPANVHFDAVSSDMVPLINAGLSLNEAYDKAVWANPVTRELMLQQRLTDAEAEKQKKAREEGEAAARATAHNVRGTQTSRKPPTETKGKMDDTMRETLRELRSRAH